MTFRFEILGKLRATFFSKPIFFLILMAIAMPISFSTWSVLINNFVVETANFSGIEFGWLHSIREVPGLLAVGVILVLLFLHEQTVACLTLLLLGFATAITTLLPSFQGLLLTTLLGSIGFHYFETVNQSLQLQWLNKKKAPVILGLLIALGSFTSLVIYSVIVFGWKPLNFSFTFIFSIAGIVTFIISIIALLGFKQFEVQKRSKPQFVLRKKYWLYYVLEFLAGARRQIFIVFAVFMMVEKFGLEVNELTALFLINFVLNIFFGPVIGLFVKNFGERIALIIEYFGLILIFVAYAGIYLFDFSVAVACCLYVLDHLFFSMGIAQKTYFQKISDAEDITPTTAVAFTINHIAAVFLPLFLGYIWVSKPEVVFLVAAGLAFLSLSFSFIVPSNPRPNKTTIF